MTVFHGFGKVLLDMAPKIVYGVARGVDDMTGHGPYAGKTVFFFLHSHFKGIAFLFQGVGASCRGIASENAVFVRFKINERCFRIVSLAYFGKYGQKFRQWVIEVFSF